MKNVNLKKELKEEMENITPSNFDKILSKMEKKEGNILKMEKAEKKKNTLLFRYATATCLLVICALFGLNIYKTNKVESIITIDVNPSVEVNVNEANKVVSVVAKNDDGKKILTNVSVKGKDYNVAVNTIMEEIVKDGYIDATRNAVLVTVINDNNKTSEKIRVNVVNEVSKSLKNTNVDVAVLSQTGSKNDEKMVEIKANDNNISVGKAIYLDKVVTSNKSYDFSNLAKLTIGELNKIANATNEKVNIIVNNIFANVKVSDNNTNVNVETNDDQTGVNVNDDDTNVNVNTNKNNTTVDVHDNDTNVNVNTGINGTGVSVGDNGESVGVDINKDNIEVNVNDKDLLSKTAVKVIVAATSKSVSVDGYNVTLDKNNNQYIVTFKTKQGITMQYTLDAKTGMITDIKIK